MFTKKTNVFKPVVSYVQIVKLITALANFSMITLESVKRDVNETEWLGYNTGNKSPRNVWHPKNGQDVTQG